MTFIRAEGLMEFKRQYMFRRAFPLLLGPLDGIQEWRIRNKDVTNMKIIPRHQEDGTTWLALLSDGRNCLIFDTSNMTDVLVFQIRRESTEPTRDGFLKLRLPVRGRWCVRSIHDRRSSTPPDDTTQMATIQFAQPKACLKFRRAVEDNWGIILQQQIFRLKIYVKSTLRKKVLAEYKHDYIFLEIFEKYDSPWKRVVKVWVFNPNVVEEAPKRYEQRCDEKTRISFKKNTLDNPVKPGDVQQLLEPLDLTILPDEAADYERLLAVVHDCAVNVSQLPDYQPLPDIKKYPRENVRLPGPGEQEFGHAWVYRFRIQGENPPKGGDVSLTGKTVCVKDCISVAGVPLSFGSNAFPAWTPEADATIITRVLDAGADMVGTATCESFCNSAASFTSAQDIVPNPHQPGYSAGGSTSGGEALVGSVPNRRSKWAGPPEPLCEGFTSREAW
ncbi:hypothetical protein H634G_10855 [Metarhizium anisopliae BRIP 53293]|uniref:Amidase domain-containing protein n=1 Tax=Metarhizium anisopliae BRIP 53293 TaxID=1291518 RepID=A0A0D9NIP4_METAN|nr:hypothetical protein H634G_10855 [Metarhizium anisopliae BRIP 53293]